MTRHATSALVNALDVRDLPLMPLVRILARVRWQVRLRRLPITLLILLIIAAATVALITIPADFDIEGRVNCNRSCGGISTHLSTVMSSCCGLCRGRSAMWKSSLSTRTVVVVLQNPQLDYEILRVVGELQTAESELQTLKVTMAVAARRGTSEDRNRAEERSARFKELEARIDSLQKQRDNLREQESLLTINSPIDGEVLTWNVIEKLRTRPVLRGQKLMEVAATDGDWIVELRVPEHDIGHVLDAQKDFRENLDVHFILKTDPGIEYEGTVQSIARAIETDANTGSTVMITVRFEAASLPSFGPARK